MPKYKVTMRSGRMGDTVRARLELEVEAVDMDEAKSLVSDSLPGYDWDRWVSAWGITEVDPPPRIYAPLTEVEQSVKPA